MAESRIVLIRPGALGDALLVIPTLALLRVVRPSVHATVVARRDVLPLLHAAGLADAVYPYDLPAWSALFARNVAAAEPLARRVVAGAEVVAWLSDPDGGVAANLGALGARTVVVRPGSAAPDEVVHMALQIARALRPLGIPVPETAEALRASVSPLRLSPDDVAQAEQTWRALGLPDAARVVALHPGSGGAVKRWPPGHFAALSGAIRAWGGHPLLLAGPQDEEVCAAVQAATRTALPVARDLALGQVAALLRRCSGYVGNDSGVSHLAAMLDVPALALFGPTDPAIWAPLGSLVRVLRAPVGSMERLAVGTVVEALRDLLAPPPAP